MVNKMSCFPNLSWPSCAPDPSKGIYECSGSIDQNCCLSTETMDKAKNNCPDGFESVPANGEWCTSARDWNPFDGKDTTMYRHKCKRKQAPCPPPQPCNCPAPPPPPPCPPPPPPQPCNCPAPPPCNCPACPTCRPVVPPTFGIVYVLAKPAKEKTFEIMLGWTSPELDGINVFVYDGNGELIQPVGKPVTERTNVEAGMFVTTLTLLKPSSYSVVYTIRLKQGQVGSAETELQVDFPDFANNNLKCGDPTNFCESWEKCVEGRCRAPCDVGMTLCKDECVDLYDNNNNCGGCGTSCRPDQSCEASMCRTR